MTVFHNTDTIILCGLDILDLTANQDWAVSMFSHQAVNSFSRSVALLWGNLLKKFSCRKSFIVSLWLSCQILSILLQIFSSFNHLFICFFWYFLPFLHRLPTTPIPSTFTPPTLSFVLLYTPTSILNRTPRDVAVQSDWELAIHDCFFLQRLWLDCFFPFHLLQLLFSIERPLWLNFLISRPVE